MVNRWRSLRTRFERWIGRPGHFELDRYAAVVEHAGSLESELSDLDEVQFRSRLRRTDRDAQRPTAELDPGFLCALGREAARRGLGQRAYDVQLQAVAALLAPLSGGSGIVVELATGEGKTLVGAITAAAYALDGRSVRVLSVNDYLAERDATWMGPVFANLGVSVGWITQSSSPQERREAYANQVCYVSVSEAGFDLLRDRTRPVGAGPVQNEADVALVDEADSVLIDEARVPLVLAGAAAGADDLTAAASLVAALRPDRDFRVDADGRAVSLTEDGIAAVEKAGQLENLYADADLLSRVNVALHARTLVHRDVDYLITDGSLRLIDPDRGRVAELRRWPDGLHAAVEAKEGLAVTERGEVLDQLTVQELISGYPVVIGMTGTAVSASDQLRELYALETGALPTQRPLIRIDEPDQTFATLEAKELALIERVVAEHAEGRPTLIGTGDVAESERLAAALAEHGVDSEVLNARDDAREAEIIARAGAYGAVTVSTQMAGRGTDIRLGGPDETDHDRVAELGGLLVIGSSRYPSQRLDDQLRGRAGRQGDPGASVFFVADTDPLIIRGGAELTAADADHAQRIAEGEAAELRRVTGQYTEQLRAQRRQVLVWREKLITEVAAAERLAEAAPQRWAEAAEIADADALALSARRLLVACLDRRWSDQLAHADHVREGIHFRSLGRENPLQGFNAEIAGTYRGFAEAVLADAVTTLSEAEVTVDGIDTADLDRHAGATWTYLITDNPFGSPVDLLLAAAGRAVRRLVRD